MRVTHEIGITKDRAPKDNLKGVEDGDPFGDMFDKRGLSNAVGGKEEVACSTKEIRGRCATERLGKQL